MGAPQELGPATAVVSTSKGEGDVAHETENCWGTPVPFVTVTGTHGDSEPAGTDPRSSAPSAK